MVELIHVGYPCWNVNVIQKIFSTKQVKVITSIPLSLCGRDEGKLSKGLRQQNVWMTIWKFQVTNGVKKFISRPCKYILPTSQNIKRTKSIENYLALFAFVTLNQ